MLFNSPRVGLIILLGFISSACAVAPPLCALPCDTEADAGEFGCIDDATCSCNPPASNKYLACVQNVCPPAEVQEFVAWATGYCAPYVEQSGSSSAAGEVTSTAQSANTATTTATQTSGGSSSGSGFGGSGEGSSSGSGGQTVTVTTGGTTSSTSTNHNGAAKDLPLGVSTSALLGLAAMLFF